MQVDLRKLTASTSAALLVVTVLAANLWWAKPLYNWDLVGYVGAAVSLDDGNTSTVHAKTWAEIRDAVPPDVYELLAGQTYLSAYRVAVASDPESFIQQLPLARIKPLYLASIYAFGAAGINLVTATVLVSIIGYCLIAAVCFIWLRREFPPLIAALFVSCLASMPFVLELSMLSTPDALSVAIVLTGFVLATRESTQGIALFVIVFAILARPDNVILALCMSAIGFRYWKNIRLISVSTAILAVILYLAIMHYAGMYPWSTTFYHAFVETLPYPADHHAELSAGQYLHALARSSHPWKSRNNSGSLILMMVLAVLALRLMWARVGKFDSTMQLLGAAGAYGILHWLILPSQKDRLLADLYLLIIILLSIEVQRSVSAAAKRYAAPIASNKKSHQ